MILGEYRGFQWRIEPRKQFIRKAYIMTEYINGNICKKRRVRKDSKGYYIISFFNFATKARLELIIDEIINSYAVDSDKYKIAKEEFSHLLDI
jgi:hypothetical protein